MWLPLLNLGFIEYCSFSESNAPVALNVGCCSTCAAWKRSQVAFATTSAGVETGKKGRQLPDHKNDSLRQLDSQDD